MNAFLQQGQVWFPHNGERPREIEAVHAAGVHEPRWPMGTVIISWSATMSDRGRCSQASFRAWIRRTKATLKAR